MKGFIYRIYPWAILRKKQCFFYHSSKAFTQDTSKVLLLNLNTNNKAKSLTSHEVRQSFFDYFIHEHQHEFYGSSSVKPAEHDQSLLFVNAGMNQFKPIFLDKLDQFESLRLLRRVVNSQKCIRVGGKHCDLETVGTDFTHHTFFEMLGNWSFNDYFKAEACSMAWNLLTKIYRIDQRRLFVTIFAGNEELGLEPDLETYEIWRSIGIPKHRIIPLGMRDNFWEMGQTGPCGICTEIHYLLKEPSSSNHTHLKNFMLENSIEIWNLVFIQYFRDQNEKLNRLKKNFVDTGMGLERILSLIQNVPNNYATDLFTPYFDRLFKLCKWPEYSHKLDDDKDIAYRILADHSRMASVAIADGIEPDDRGAGYFLRRVIRRAIDSIKTFTKIQPFPNDVTELDVFFTLADTTINILGKTFPELERESSRIFQVFNEEIRLFSTAILRNSAVVKYSRLLQMNINEDYEHNQKEVIEKLEQIHLNIKRVETLLKNDFINGQQELDQQRRDLQNVQELISIDSTLAQRFGLFNGQIESKFKNVDIKLTQLENEVLNAFEQIIEGFQLEASKRIYHGKNFIILPVGNTDFIPSYYNLDLQNFLSKISLDLYGRNPLALVLKIIKLNSIFVQLSIPSRFQQKLQANTWFDLVLKELPSPELLKIKSIFTKRMRKIVKYRLDYVDNNHCDVQKIFEFLVSNLQNVAQKHFDDCK